MSDGFARFRDELARHVPGLPPGATDAFDITRHGLLDHLQRVALRTFVLDVADGLSVEAVESATDLGGVWTLVSRFVGDAAGPSLEPIGRVQSSWRTRRVQLQPVNPGHFGPLYVAATSPVDGFRWRWRGRTPSPEEFQQSLFSGVKTQFAIEETDTGELVGLVVAYDEDPTCEHCFIGFQRAAGPSVAPGGMVEGMALFLEFLFESFPYRRVILDVPEYNLPLLGSSLESLVSLEGRISDFYFHGGRRWDRCFMSIWRDAWEPIGSAFMGRTAAEASGSPARTGPA